MTQQKTKIIEMIEPAIQDMGLILWGCDFVQAGKYTVLRIYIDGPNNTGVTVDNCAKVSREIGALLDVEDPVQGQYQLEVSSPGIERPLYTPDQFAQYVDHQVRVKLREAVSGKRQFNAHIVRVENDEITLGVDDITITVHISDVQKANLMLKG